MKWPTSRSFGLVRTAQRFSDAFRYESVDQRQPWRGIKDARCYRQCFRPWLSVCKIYFSVRSSEG